MFEIRSKAAWAGAPPIARMTVEILSNAWAAGPIVPGSLAKGAEVRVGDRAVRVTDPADDEGADGSGENSTTDKPADPDIGGEGVQMLFFTADSSIPDRSIRPAVERMQEEGLPIVTLKTDERPELMQRYVRERRPDVHPLEERGGDVAIGRRAGRRCGRPRPEAPRQTWKRPPFPLRL